jgi:hypothetical protein
MFSKKFRLVFAAARAALASMALLTLGFSQVVDCIVAEVNTQIITLTDIRILQAFAISAGGTGENSASSLRQILEGAVDQRIVIDLVRENITVTKEEVDNQLKEMLERLEPEDRQRKLDEFGLREDDLRPYLEEKLLFEKIIALRFSQSINVSLKEIETYYNEVYLPSQKVRGVEPEPMIELLNEIESLIKKDRTEKQVTSWIKSLRNQAEVRVNSGCLEQIK